MDSAAVYQYADRTGVEWTRKARNGDYENTIGGTFRVGHRQKVYLPLLHMGDFEELMNRLMRCMQKSG